MIHHPAVVSKHGHQLSATMASYSYQVNMLRNELQLGNPSDVFLFQITFHFLLGFLDHIGGLPSAGEKEAFLNCRSCLKDRISCSLCPFVCESRTK